MKLSQILLVSAVSCSMGPLALAGGEAPARTQSDQAMPLQGAGPQAQEGPAGAQGQAAPDAATKAKVNGAHSPPDAHTGEETIRQVQEKLNEQGYQAGAADGIWGPKTKAAIEKFQQAKGITGDGDINPQTLAALGVDSEAETMTGGAGEGAQESGGAETGAVEQQSGDGQGRQPGGQESESAQESPAEQPRS